MFLCQSYQAHEIIIIDQTRLHDDLTESALSNWSKERLILWIRQPEANASKARNVGALAASGDVLLLLDDDICVKPDFLAAYAETFQKKDPAGVSGQVLEGGMGETNKLPSLATHPKLGWLFFPKNYSKECATAAMISCNVAVRRDIYLRLGGMDENYERGAYREESDFAMRFMHAGHHFIFNPKCSIVHLGAKIITGGGARSWWRESRFWYFHHCVGDWYFNLKYSTPSTFIYLYYKSLRYFVLKRPHISNPWNLLIAFMTWLAAAPVAAVRRIRGAKLIQSDSIQRLL